MIEGDWKEDISTKTATLKVLDGEVKPLVFLDEGKKKESPNFGNSIVFQVRVDGETEVKSFYVKANNFDLLGQIKELGTLKGLHVEISRKGKLRTDTRYSIRRL